VARICLGHCDHRKDHIVQYGVRSVRKASIWLRLYFAIISGSLGMSLMAVQLNEDGALSVVKGLGCWPCCYGRPDRLDWGTFWWL
jgi:hypothetical protein